MRTLANGLTVYTAKDSNTANVSVQVWYKVGGKDDPAGRSGFAHLFEHLMFKATRNLPPETFDRLSEDVGGYNNAFTAQDMTAYYEVVPANHLERVLFAEAERMGSLVVDDAAFVSERDVVKEELRQRVLASPYGRLFSLYLPRESYREHPYRRPVIGSIEDLDAATIEEVLQFHATFYRPDNAYLIVVGNFDERQLNGWIDKYFGPIARPDRPLPVNDVPEPKRTAAETVTYYAPNVPLPAVVLNWQVPRYEHPDRAALTVLDAIMSYGKSCRLYRGLVYEQQCANEADTMLSMSQQAGGYSLYAVMAEGRSLEEGERALLAEVEKFCESPASEAELDEAKHEIVAGYLRKRETVSGRGEEVGHSLIMTGTPDSTERLVAEVQRITAADVQRVARLYLRDGRYVTLRYLNDEQKPADAPAEPRGLALDAPVTLASLAAAGPVVTLAPEDVRVPLPAPGPELSVPTPEVHQRTLGNGMRVLVASRHVVPLISARLGFVAGASADPDGKAGLADLTARLMTRGTTTRTATQIATEIETLGASIGASSGYDFSSMYANSPADVFEKTAALLADIAKNPAFAEADVERVKALTLDELRIARSRPSSLAGSAISRAVYGAAPYGIAADGTPKSVPTIVPADLAQFHRSRWRPSLATLVFSGDIRPEAAFALAERLFGDWRDAPDAAEPIENPAGAVLPPRVVLIDQPDAAQASVRTVNRAIARNDPDYHALLLANAVLGGGYSARLNRRIRVERGLSYGASSWLSARRDQGLVIASSETRNDAASDVVELMLTELRRLGSEPVPADELLTRRTSLIGDFSRSLESVDGIGQQVAHLALYSLPIEELHQHVDKLRAITPEQLRAVASRRLSAAHSCVIVAGDVRQFADALRKQHPHAERIPASELDLDKPGLR